MLESFALGTRLTRGPGVRPRRARWSRSTSRPARSRAVGAGLAAEAVPGRRSGLRRSTEPVWARVEIALAEQALSSARLLAGEVPAELEEVFAAAGAPLFPRAVGELASRCSCPDLAVPCKHLAATFYLLAEAFDADPFQILRWRGRDRETLLATLRALRGDAGPPGSPPPARRTARRRRQPVTGAAARWPTCPAPTGRDGGPVLVAPVPLPARPPTLDTDVDLLLRQLATPPATIGGADLAARLRHLYQAFRPPRP